MSVTRRGHTSAAHGDGEMIVATVRRATPLVAGGLNVSASIDITEPLGDASADGPPEVTDAVYRSDARDIYDALVGSLPGGTLDALFVVMAEAAATRYRVRHRTWTLAERADTVLAQLAEVAAMLPPGMTLGFGPPVVAALDDDEVVEAVIYCGADCGHPEHGDKPCLAPLDGVLVCPCRGGSPA